MRQFTDVLDSDSWKIRFGEAHLSEIRIKSLKNSQLVHVKYNFVCADNCLPWINKENLQGIGSALLLHEHPDTSGKSPQVKCDIIFVWIETFKQHFYRKSHKNPSRVETFTSGCSLRSSKTEPSEWTLFNRRLRSRCLDSPLCSASGSNQRRSLHTTSVCIERLPNCSA